MIDMKPELHWATPFRTATENWSQDNAPRYLSTNFYLGIIADDEKKKQFSEALNKTLSNLEHSDWEFCKAVIDPHDQPSFRAISTLQCKEGSFIYKADDSELSFLLNFSILVRDQAFPIYVEYSDDGSTIKKLSLSKPMRDIYRTNHPPSATALREKFKQVRELYGDMYNSGLAYDEYIGGMKLIM